MQAPVRRPSPCVPPRPLFGNRLLLPGAPDEGQGNERPGREGVRRGMQDPDLESEKCCYTARYTIDC